MDEIDANGGYLYSHMGSNPDLKEIVDLFIEEMPGRVTILLDRLNTGDWEGLRGAAHQLKGAAGSYGFATISPCAGRVENAVHDGLPEEQIRQAVMELVNLCNRARAGQPTPA